MIVQELVAHLGLSVDEQAFDRMGVVMGGLRTGLLGLGAAVGAIAVGVGALVHSTARTAGNLADLSQRTGVSTDTLQELAQAAVVSGTSLDGVANGLRFLARNASEAAGGNTDLAAAFAKAGVRLRDTNGHLRSADDLLVSAADHFKSMPDGVAKTALAMKLFGKSGTELIPLLNEGSEGLARFRQEARDFGAVLDKDTLQSAAALDDEFDRMGQAVTGLKYAIAGPFVRGFTTAAIALRNLVVGVQKFTKANLGPALVKVGKVFDALAGYAGAFKVALVVAASFIAAAYIPTLISLVTWYGALTVAQLLAGGSAVAAGLAAAGAWLMATAPLALLIAGVVLLADELYTFATGGDSMLGRLVKWFDTTDPSDSSFMAGLKSIGSLIFDFTDGKKWERALTAWARIVDAAVSVVERRLDGMFGGLGKVVRVAAQLGAAPMLGALAGGAALFGDAPAAASPSAFGGGASPAASASTAAAGTAGSPFELAPTMSAPITITVPPGTDAAGVASMTTQALDEWWNEKLQASYPAAGY